MDQIVPYAPTQDEKMTAMLAHLLQILAWFIGPLVIFVSKRESRFVSFHSVQALICQGIWAVFGIAMLSTVVAWMIIVKAVHAGGNQSPPIAFFVVFGLFWIVSMAVWPLMLVLSILHGVKAMNGEWSEYPIIGRWARRWYGAPAQRDSKADPNPAPNA